MPRRLVLISALLGLILAAIAIIPWTLASRGPEAMIIRQMRRDYGLQVDVRGESTFALLPTPRIKLEDISIQGLDGRIAIDGATLRGELGLWSLIRGQVELTEVALSDAKVDINLKDANDSFWMNSAARLRLQGFDSKARQLIIANSSAVIHRDKHADIILDALNIAVDWPEDNAPFSMTASTSWKGKVISISKADFLPSALLNGKPSPFNFSITAAESRIDLSGSIRFDRAWNATLSGQSSARTASLRNLANWTDLALPLAPLVEAVAIEGEFSTQKNVVSWPSVRIRLGEDRLEGSLSFRLDEERNAVDGTLATDNLDLTRFLLPVGDLFDDRKPPPSLRELNRADLDLRLSAAAGKIGMLQMNDMAFSLLLKPDRFEASLSRATIDKGVAKGRLLVTGPAEAREVKVLGSLDNVAMTSLAFGTEVKMPIVTGTVQGLINLESRGATMTEILKQSHGRIVATVANGEIRGFSIPDTLRQTKGKASTGTPELVKGNTPFSTARMIVSVEGGMGWITDGSIVMAGASSELRGGIFLPDRSLAVSSLSFSNKTENRTGLVIGMEGPWSTPRLTTHIIEDARPAPSPGTNNQP